MKAEAAQLNNLSNFAGTKLGWVPIAVRDQEFLVSPLHSLLKIAQRSKLLSPDSTKLAVAPEGTAVGVAPA